MRPENLRIGKYNRNSWIGSGMPQGMEAQELWDDTDPGKQIWRTIRRVLFLAVGLVGGIWFSLPFVLHGIINIGNATGIAVAVLFLLGGLFQNTIDRWIGALWDRVLGKVLLVAAGIITAVLVLVVVALTSVMIHAAVQKPVGNEPLVVLGCRVYGERASLMLQERLDAAYEYLLENPESVAILSGGQGEGEDISEALCMFRYLADKGIEESRLYLEETSTSTRENIEFSMEVIREELPELAAETIAVATNEFHEYRAGKVAQALGVEAVSVPGKTALYLLPTYYVRELYGILYELIQ